MAEKKVVPEGYREKVERSPLPVYAFGIVVLVYALCFPFYKLGHYITAAAAAGLVSLILSVFTPKKITYVPKDPAPTGNASADEFLKKSRDMLASLRKADEDIKDEEVSRKIVEIEDTCKKIFAHVESHPQKEKQLRRFMDYYIPTSLKLLNSYAELERQGVPGENIDGTKARISGMLDKIKEAFDRQLDALFGDMSMDISGDITVMESLLASQGLLHDKED